MKTFILSFSSNRNHREITDQYKLVVLIWRFESFRGGDPILEQCEVVKLVYYSMKNEGQSMIFLFIVTSLPDPKMFLPAHVEVLKLISRFSFFHFLELFTQNQT